MLSSCQQLCDGGLFVSAKYLTETHNLAQIDRRHPVGVIIANHRYSITPINWFVIAVTSFDNVAPRGCLEGVTVMRTNLCCVRLAFI